MQLLRMCAIAGGENRDRTCRRVVEEDLHPRYAIFVIISCIEYSVVLESFFTIFDFVIEPADRSGNTHRTWLTDSLSSKKPLCINLKLFLFSGMRWRVKV